MDNIDNLSDYSKYISDSHESFISFQEEYTTIIKKQDDYLKNKIVNKKEVDSLFNCSIDDKIIDVYKTIISIENDIIRLIFTITSSDFNTFIIKNYKIIKNLDEIKIFIPSINKSLNQSITELVTKIYPKEKSLEILSMELSAKKSNLFDLLKGYCSNIESIYSYILNESTVTPPSNLPKQEVDLLLKKFQQQTSLMLSEINNNFRSLNLDIEKVSKSNNLNKKNYEDLVISIESFDSKVNEYDKKLTDALKEKNNDFDIKFENIEKQSETKFNSFQDSVGIIVEDIEKTHIDFKNLVGNAGIYNLTKNYNDKATEEKNEYKIYRKYTTWSILAAVFFTLLIFIIAFFEKSAINTSPDYLILISRLSISAMFFILALYLSKQASKHYECYQENHRTFLQLAALEPFMASMTPDEQKEIRKGLIPSYFNQGLDGKFAAKGDEVDMAMMFTFMDKLSTFGHNKKDTKAIDNATAETKT